jgi:multidrug resistance efflux pump
MTLTKKQLIRVAIFAVIAVLALLIVVHLWRYYTQEPWTRDGRIRGDVMRISADVSGLVTDVLVKDNQTVKQGGLLFVIDPARYQIAVEQAKANLAKVKADLANSNQQRLSAQANILQSQASVAEVQAQVDKAAKDLARINMLKNSNAVSKQEQDSYQAAYAQAAANLEKAKSGIEVSKQSLNSVTTNKDALLAAVDSATTALHLAELNLQRTAIRAPSNGTLSNFDLKAGNYVSSGQPIAAILNREELYVVGYFEETKLARIQINDPVRIQLMGDSREMTGHVQGIAAGIEDRERASSNNMLANINPTFNWVRLAQRIPVRITLDKVPDPAMLVAGRTVTVHIQHQKHQEPHRSTAHH